MKRLKEYALIGVAATVLPLTFSSCGTSKEFRDLKGENGVEMIHIPRGVGVFVNIAGAFSSGKDGGQALRGFRSMDVVECGRNVDRDKVNAAIEKAIRRDKAELLVEVRESREKILIYGRPSDKGDQIRDVIVVTEAPSGIDIVRAKGTFSLKDVANENIGKSGR